VVQSMPLFDADFREVVENPSQGTERKSICEEIVCGEEKNTGSSPLKCINGIAEKIGRIEY